MKSWQLVILSSFVIIILIFAGFGFVAYYSVPAQTDIAANATLNAQIQIPAPEQCKNLDLIMTSECLEKDVEGYFNYTIRDDEERTLQDIKLNGGDCFDYNNLYVKWLKDLGFNAELIQFDLNNETSHVLALGYTHNSYCILDQTVHPSCVILGEEAK
jgi:hypothetical protein